MVPARSFSAILQRSPRTEGVFNVPLASGFITGEALLLLLLAIWSAVAP